MRQFEKDSVLSCFWLWAFVGWGLVTVVIYFSLISSPPEPLRFAFADKLEHFFAYGVLMVWFGQLYSSFKNQLVFALLFSLLGVSLEFVQDWSGHRFFDVADMLSNTLGVLLGWWLTRTVFAGFLLKVDRGLSRMFPTK